MQHTVDSIKALLANNDRAVGRALIVLRNRQTADEQRTEQTKHQNGRGFRPCHARMGTSMANFFERRGYLTEKQVNYWRARMADGNSRIEIYSRQLLEEAAAKAAAKQASTAPKFRAQREGEDLGNHEEERIVWDEMAAEREMQRMEAEADRQQTIRDEMNKWRARTAMEAA
jgi:hypothetical protein